MNYISQSPGLERTLSLPFMADGLTGVLPYVKLFSQRLLGQVVNILKGKQIHLEELISLLISLALSYYKIFKARFVVSNCLGRGEWGSWETE